MLRLANSVDLDTVYEIYMHEEVIPFLGFDPMPKPEFGKLFHTLVASKNFFVVEKDGIVAGFYRVTRYEGRARHVASLGTLAISPREKGTGFALEMISEAIGRLKDAGVLRVELTLEADSPRAFAFYKKLGFVFEGTQRAAYKRADQEEYIDELFLARLLEPLLGAK
jgi:RimJ/RimL family protein N-acetyltransferase